MTARASLSADGQRVTLEKGLWSETFPIAKLPGRIAFYRSLVDETRQKMRMRGATGACAHEQTLAALEAVACQVTAGAQ